MKRKYYKVHHYDYARPMRRVKHHDIPWAQLLMIGLVVILLGVGVFAIVKWANADKPKTNVDTQSGDVQTPSPVSSGDISAPTAVPSQTVAPTLSPELSVNPISGISAADFGFSTKIMYDGAEVSSWQSNVDMSFGSGHTYAAVAGILTFAGNNYRSGSSYGNPLVENETLIQIWNASVGSLSMSGYGGTGTGWTGQPIIVKWSAEVRATLGVFEQFKTDDEFVEVIYPTMDGNIYFFDLESGERSRNPINIGVITKGTAALDPRGYPMLYTGQGITSTSADGMYSGTWVRAVNLITNKVDYSFGGKDPFSPRQWQAYDSSPLICADADTLIMPGENGVIYFVKLNSVFNAETGSMTIEPGPLLKYKYMASSGYSPTDEEGYSWYGFESSAACWSHYLFITDNGGHLQCIDMNTLELKYVLDTTDDSDVSIVIEEDYTDGKVYLYTANEVDKQRLNADGTGTSYHRKFNALTGELVWENPVTAYVGGSSSNGGTLATPHVGTGEISNLVIYSMTLAKVTYTNAQGNEVTEGGGLMIAYDKHTGEEVWRYVQEFGYWSSPVVVYSASGKAYIVQCDRDGVVTLHNAADGTAITTLDIGSRIESTPAIFNGIIVVGTRGAGGRGRAAGIFGIRLD